MVVSLLAFLVVGCLFLVAFTKKRTNLLFLLLIPLLAVIDSIYFHYLPDSFVSFCFFIAAFAIAFFPLLFLSENFKKGMALFILVCMLIQWDWLMTWYYVFQNAAAELNSLLNVSSFSIFSLQKLLPLGLLGVLYYAAKDQIKLKKVLMVALVVIAVAYYVLFLWHLHVVSVVSISLYYLLLISLFNGVFSVSGILKNYLIRKGLINSI